jgi:hypothetical protein
MGKSEKRLDLDSELGVSRRDLLRRGAIVGGTLLWVAPVVQSLNTKAYAQTQAGSGACATCYCAFIGPNGRLRYDECNVDGITGIYASDATCASFCAAGGSAGKTYNTHQYCSGTDCACASKSANNEKIGSPKHFGVECPA